MNRKKWWQYLLAIPLMALVDIVVLVIAGLIDSNNDSSQLGHSMPAVIIVAGFVLSIISIVVIIRSITMAIRSVKSPQEKNLNGYRPKPVWKCFIPLVLEIVISVLTVIIAGHYEINNFYSDPNHIGFAVPIVTITIAVIMIIVMAVTFVITLIVARKRAIRNEEYDEQSKTSYDAKNDLFLK